MKKYEVLIVDDEPAAINFISKIIELKCPQLEVVATANSGLEALTLLHTRPIDIVFTDIKMPEMDGVELVKTINRDFPYVCSVVVSGHQDFDYVKESLRVGVVDYLLKPISPIDVENLCEPICIKLDKQYQKRRNLFLRHISSGQKNINVKELKQLFPAQHYYAAIIRKNGLISRFGNSINREIFSSENNLMTIFGRDHMEMLFIYSEEVVITDFFDIMNHEYQKLKDAGAFLTMVINENRFELTFFSKVVNDLYQTLDNSIVVGLEQILFLGKRTANRLETSQSTDHFRYLLYLIEKKQNDRLTTETRLMFDMWIQEIQSQFEIENKIR
ncbi:MAG: response regulator, partial [Suipraeoptans sp.]